MIRNYGKILFRWNFIVGVICVFFVLQLDTELPIFMSSQEWEIMRETSDFMEYICNAIYFGMYLSMVCIIATISFGIQFHEEWKAGVVPQIVKKTGITKYAMLYTWFAIVSGGGIVAVGFIAYAVYMTKYILLLNPATLEEKLQFGLYNYTLDDKTGLQYVIVMTLLMFVVGALSAVIALCVSTISANKYLVMFSPYLIYKIYVEICKLSHVSYKYRVDFYLFGRNTLGESLGQMIMIVMIILMIIFIVGGYAFKKGVQRKLIYDKY